MCIEISQPLDPLLLVESFWILFFFCRARSRDGLVELRLRCHCHRAGPLTPHGGPQAGPRRGQPRGGQLCLWGGGVNPEGSHVMAGGARPLG